MAIKKKFENITFAKELKCGECLLSGHIFCLKKENLATLLVDQITNETMPENYCCDAADEASCEYLTNEEYMCTKDLPLYFSLGLCPWDKAKCGEERFLVAKKDEKGKILLPSKLEKKDFCYYGVVSDCGVVPIEGEGAAEYELLVPFHHELTKEEAEGDDMFKQFLYNKTEEEMMEECKLTTAWIAVIYPERMNASMNATEGEGGEIIDAEVIPVEGGEGEGSEEAPVEGSGEEAPVEGEGEEAPVEGEGTEEAPVEGEGTEEAPVEGEGEEA